MIYYTRHPDTNEHFLLVYLPENLFSSFWSSRRPLCYNINVFYTVFIDAVPLSTGNAARDSAAAAASAAATKKRKKNRLKRKQREKEKKEREEKERLEKEKQEEEMAEGVLSERAIEEKKRAEEQRLERYKSMTVLMHAAENGRLDLVKWLTKSGNADIHATDSQVYSRPSSTLFRRHLLGGFIDFFSFFLTDYTWFRVYSQAYTYILIFLTSTTHSSLCNRLIGLVPSSCHVLCRVPRRYFMRPRPIRLKSCNTSTRCATQTWKRRMRKDRHH